MTDFSQEGQSVLTEVGRIRLVLDDWGAHPPTDPTTGAVMPRYQVSYEGQGLDQNGAVIREKSGNAAPHLTNAEKNALKAVQDAFRPRMEKMIPPVAP